MHWWWANTCMDGQMHCACAEEQSGNRFNFDGGSGIFLECIPYEYNLDIVALTGTLDCRRFQGDILGRGYSSIWQSYGPVWTITVDLIVPDQYSTIWIDVYCGAIWRRDIFMWKLLTRTGNDSQYEDPETCFERQEMCSLFVRWADTHDTDLWSLQY